MMNEKSVKSYMSAHNMLPPAGGRVLCACSGGADSTALLHLLCGMAGVSVLCAHFDHRLRGAESARDAAFVEQLCADWGIAFYGGAADVRAYAREKRLGIEEAAREKRYRFLEETARDTGCGCIATAHTADDNAETVLLRLIRGAGARGLSGIPPVRDAGCGGIRVIRPLLGVTRAEIEEYLRVHALPHVEDSSNALDDYARNRLRHAVIPRLKALNPRAVENICAAAELLREDENYLGGLAEAFIAANVRDGVLPVPALRELPKPVAMRVFRNCRPGASREHFEALYALCRSGTGRAALDLPGGRVTREGETLYFGGVPARPDVPRRELRPGETVRVPELGLAVRRSATEYTKEIHKRFNTFYFQSEKICDNIYVACRAPGDAIRLEGRNCTKSLRKLLREAGLTPAERARVLVISDGAGPIAVSGFPAVAERCAPVPGRAAVKIEIFSEV